MRLLACQVLAMSMRRVDLMLFSCLLMGGVEGSLPKAVAGAYAEVASLFPNLDEAALPFSEVRGILPPAARPRSSVFFPKFAYDRLYPRVSLGSSPGTPVFRDRDAH
jgi:hypothetical protein